MVTKYKNHVKFSEAVCCDNGEEAWDHCPLCELSQLRTEATSPLAIETGVHPSWATESRQSLLQLATFQAARADATDELLAEANATIKEMEKILHEGIPYSIIGNFPKQTAQAAVHEYAEVQAQLVAYKKMYWVEKNWRMELYDELNQED